VDFGPGGDFSPALVKIGREAENLRKKQHLSAGVDPQLDRAIEMILQQIAENPPELPDFGERPKRVLPKLPPR